MSRVMSMHETILHHGVSEEAFERFLREDLPPAMANFTDFKMYVLKGERGDRKGRYMTVVEFESLEARNRYFPGSGQPSEAGKQTLEQLGPFIEKWRTFANYGNPTFTDYVQIA
jgi:hypothetical protein